MLIQSLGLATLTLSLLGAGRLNLAPFVGASKGEDDVWRWSDG